MRERERKREEGKREREREREKEAERERKRQRGREKEGKKIERRRITNCYCRHPVVVLTYAHLKSGEKEESRKNELLRKISF